MIQRLLLPATLALLLLASCAKKSGSDEGSAKVALSGDVENFNPVVTNSAIAAEVNQVIFPMLFELTFDFTEGHLVYKPGLVQRWEALNGGKDIKLHLRRDIRWEDGVAVTPEDIKFSFELYGDPEVASPRSNYVKHMMFTDGKFDVNKSIEILDDSTMVFHFTHAYPQQLFHLNLSPIPRHVYRNADRRTLRSNPANEKPLSAGPFRLEKWVRGQEIVLATNAKCTLPHPAVLNKVIFRVTHEATTRLTELKRGTVDMMWPIYPEDVKDIQANNKDVNLVTRHPRVYEYIGWANIDFAEYRKSGGKTITPHPLFGSRAVRQALTYGINRKAIIDAKLGPYGELALSDVSPIFRWAINHELVPYAYNPDKARTLLREAGWLDTDGDGILDKGSVRFEFTLHYNTGNARRAYAATVVQDNLKQLGIKVNLMSVEPVVFFENIAQKKYDAFMAGMEVGLAIDPTDRWGDLKNPFNNTGFQNARVNELIKLGLNSTTDQAAAPFWKDIQAILHQEQPCTFLYWIKDIVGINRKLKGTNVNILGVLDGMWDWKIGDPNSYATF